MPHENEERGKFMQFRLLGPLEIENGEDLVDLGGRRQRAALSFLLLHANQVVSTSQLLSALWAGDDPPVSARKILQNAIWKLRGVLSRPPLSEHAPQLLTRAPGYLLRVPAQRVDLLVYQQGVAAGRAALAAGDPQLAWQTLHEALSLWRGPVLADLVEEGTCWPELTAVQNRRHDVMEDHFEAALACGRHQLVLGKLKALVEAEPLRERAAGQLMLALYRCGRQAEALAVFGRVRAALVEGLGLEPGRELRRLHQAILTHDPALDTPARDTTALASLSVAEAARPRAEEPGSARTEAPGSARTEAPGSAHAEGPRTAAAEEPRQPPAGTDEGPHTGAAARTASVVMFRFGLGDELSGLPPEDGDQVLDALTQLAKEKTELHGGRVASILGSLLLAVFTGDTERSGDAAGAVRAAAAVRESLSIPTGTLAPPQSAVRGLTLHAAVTTGEAVVRRQPDRGATPLWVGGAIVDTCRTMLGHVQAGEIHVCDTTRRLAERSATFRHACASAFAPWELHAVTEEPTGATPRPETGPSAHESELDLMQHLLLRTRERATSHLITLVDASGRGKTRLLMEFQRRVERDFGGQVRVLAGTVRPPAAGRPPAVPAAGLAAYCGIDPAHPAHHGPDRLRETLERIEDDARTRRAVFAALAPTLSAPPPLHTPQAQRDVLAAWGTFLAGAAREQPLVVIWDDLQHADDALLDAVERLTTSHAGVPLLSIVGADPGLLDRRPGWATGRPRTMSLSVTPAPGDALDRLLESLLPPVQEPEVA
ncbi:BTAD domain-containing putative transcriptional regulator [Streptomyces sp. NPDC000151]|uniref:BTAD domain-containing putative transcriptional regulator n=1 Tax=Streptomyces sp. NPDC000151 TaxID=3154244 RepID=UPI00331A18DE